MSVYARTRILLVSIVVVLASTMWFVSGQQRTGLLSAQAETERAGELLTAMLDQETGVRGYDQTGRKEFLGPFREGRAAFERSLAAAIAQAEGSRPVLALLRSQAAHARAWEHEADQAVAHVRQNGAHALTVAGARRRKALMDRFRAENARFRVLAGARGDQRIDSARWASTALVVLIATGLLGGGLLTLERNNRADSRRRRLDLEFVTALQGADDERDAQALLRRHVERSVRGADALVLTRKSSGNLLLPSTDPEAIEGVAPRLEGAAPRDCMAVRRGAIHARNQSEEPLQPCRLCGDLPGSSVCVPSLVGGEVIGSLLVHHPEKKIGEDDRRRLAGTVGQAAPVLANLRNLAIAEHRAATDSLTGLPNARVVQDTLARMVAQAGRSTVQLSALALDLDHFKSINDSYGHQVGDEVLTAVGAVLRRTLRASDFAGRWGGEEFVVLLADTGTEGAVAVAEKLRSEIGGLVIAGAPVRVSASLGIATLPDHAGTGPDLIREADRALYAAKAAGRDRVVVAGDAPAPAA